MKNGKGSGWKGESHRHRLAGMGIKTVNDINYSGANGQLMVSNGVTESFAKLGDKLKTGFAKAKVGAVDLAKAGIQKGKELKEGISSDIKERISKSQSSPDTAVPMISPREGKPTPKKKQIGGVVKTTDSPSQLRANKSKEDIDAIKRQAKATQEFEDAVEDVSDIRGKDTTSRPEGQRTSSQHLDRTIKGVAQSGRQTRPDINVNQAMMESIDADDIIALAQNKEQLIKYTTALQHDMNKIDAERKAMSDEFKNIERTNHKTLQNSRRLQMVNSKQEMNNIKMSGLEKHKRDNKIKQIKIRNEADYRGKSNVLKDQRRQHQVDLKFADDINKDLKRLHRQIDKRVKMMIASGQPQ